MGCGQGPGEGTGVGPVTLLPPCCGRRKRSYKQAVSELDEEPQLEDEELQPPRSKTPSPPCPASKVSGPLSTTPPPWGPRHAQESSPCTLTSSTGGAAPPDLPAHRAEEPNAHDSDLGPPQQCHEILH